MIVKDIRSLLQKLDDTCTKTLERSVGFCVSRGHYEVRWEHLFVEFLDQQNNDIPLILRRFGIDSSHVKKAVQKELESLRAGNTGKPSFSPPFLEALELAWSLCSVNYGLPHITSGTLFIAALEKSQLTLSAYADLLRPINVEILKSEFLKIVAS